MKRQLNWKSLWFFPAILLFIYGIIYLPYLTRLGFYWDDWLAVFLASINNPLEYWNTLLADRPFSIWTYLLEFPILGLSPLRWQIVTLLIRIVGAWFFASTLAAIWPKRIWEARWTAILLLIFPGFTQTNIAIAYNQHFISQALLFASFWLMLKAVEKEKTSIWMVSLACFFSLLQLLTMEYFAALELIRPFLLLCYFQNRQKEPFKTSVQKSVRVWLPYLIPLLLFAVWRFGFFPRLSTENSPTMVGDLLSNPLGTLAQFIQIALQDTFSTTFSVWVNSFKPATLGSRTVISLILALFGTGLVAFWFWKTSLPDESDSPAKDRFVQQALAIGILLLVLGGLPVWVTNRQALIGLWSDRFTLAPMTGSVILLVAVTSWLTQNRQRQVIILAVLTTFAVYSQILTVDDYANNWELQRNYYWQLKWRIPDMKPNTAIIAPKMPTSYISDYSVGFAINAMYDKSPVEKKLQYWFFVGPRAKSNYFTDYAPGLPTEYTLRDIIYKGTTDQIVGVSDASGRECLRVLDPFYNLAPPRLSENLGGIEKDLQPISNVDRILPESKVTTLRSDVFGTEPDHNWCYFYQKADLARQFQKWDEIPSLATQASDLGLRSKNGVEYLPFIEGYAQTGHADKALDTSLEANTLTYGLTPALCSMWQRYEKMDSATGLPAQAAEFFNRVNCPAAP